MTKNLFVILILIVLCSCSKHQKKEVIAYFPEWGVEHQPYFVKHMIDRNAADKITVINYAFGVPTPDSLGRIYPEFMNRNHAYGDLYSAENSVDGIADDSTQALRGHFNQLMKLKKKYPELRIVVSLGGWLGSVYFSDAAKTKESREYFVDMCIDLYIKGNLPQNGTSGGKGVAVGLFDGIDIDWEYPVEGGVAGIKHDENDKENLTKLFALFRKKLDEIKPGYLLTAALPAPAKNVKNFNVTLDQKYLDWYMLMTYDFVGAWHGYAGHHSNLLRDTTKELNKISFDQTVKLFRDTYKVSPDKIIPGVGFYGRGLKLTNPSKNVLFDKGIAAPGEYEAGFDYYEHLKAKINDNKNYHWDNKSMAPWLYVEDDSTFYSFDDEQSIVLKTQYADAYNLRGVMFWEVSADDKEGTLINALYKREMKKVKVDIKEIIEKQDLEIIYPEDGSKIKSGDNLRIICNDMNNVNEVNFYVDNKLIGTDRRAPYSWVWFNTQRGDYKIKVMAKFIDGSEKFNEIYVKVVN